MSAFETTRIVRADGIHAPGWERGACHTAWEVKKYDKDYPLWMREEGLVLPYEIVIGEGNVLITTGINTMLNALIGGAITAYSNANMRLGVGDGNGSVPTPAASDTDLTAPTNKVRQAADATYPSITNNVMTTQATFATGSGNFQWREWGSFNTATAGSGMFNHAGVDLGLKTSASAWALKVTHTIT
jgi:hypothetical protein